MLPWGETADIFVINTCTVTSKAEQKARRIIRKALRDNPAACVLATGCYAQLDPSQIRGLEAQLLGVDADGASPPPVMPRLYVIPGDTKGALLVLPEYIGTHGTIQRALAAWLKDLGSASADNSQALSTATPAAQPPAALATDASTADTSADISAASAADGSSQLGNAAFDPFIFNVQDFSYHSRAFLKIQDGCDNRCSYCRVALARGPSQSLDAQTILSRLQALETHGFREAGLTGVNCGQYRGRLHHNSEDLLDFGGLLRFLLSGTKTISLRLSSLEPEGINQPLLDSLAHPRLRPHFHLSVQSGSNRILERMRRWYTREEIMRIAALLRSIKGDPFIACDIIAGFPGESQADFQETYELCEAVGFAWIHVFPYSKRPGVEAFGFSDPIPERIAASRVDALVALARRLRAEYIQRWLGKESECIIEQDEEGGLAHAGYAQAVSANYLKLLIPQGTKNLHPGTAIRCKLGPVPATYAHRGFDALGEELP